MGKQTGSGVFAIIVTLIVFLLLYDRKVNLYTNPTGIITQFLNGIWNDVVVSILSIFGWLSTVIIIALIAGVLAFKSKSR